VLVKCTDSPDHARCLAMLSRHAMKGKIAHDEGGRRKARMARVNRQGFAEYASRTISLYTHRIRSI
jgi:hypothetical protein